MKYLSLPALFLFLTLSLFAQQARISVELKNGPELLLGRDNHVPQIFGHNENTYFASTFDYTHIIVLLDNNFQEVNRKHLEFNKDVRRRKFVGLYYFHENIYLFTKEEHLKSVMLFVETIDKETLEQNGDDRMIMNVQNLAGWVSDFGIELSRTHDKLLVYSRLDAMSKKIQDVRLQLYSEDLILEWEAEQRIVYPRTQPKQSAIKVSDEGDVFIISLLDDQNVRSLVGEVKNRYHLIAATENGKVVHSYPLALPDLYIRGVQIEPGENHNLIVSGYYSPTHYRGLIDGAFYFELNNSTEEILDTKIFEFKPMLLQQAVSSHSKRAPNEMFDFRIQQLIKRNSGDFVLISENQFDQSYDAYQNIIATCFGPGGDYKWTRVVAKRQNTQSGYANHSSYYIHAPVYSDMIYFVFNERDKNEFLPEGKRLKPFNPNDPANLKVVSIGPVGEMKSQFIYRKENNKMKTPIPLRAYDKLNHEMVIPVKRLKKYEYINVTIKE